MGLRDKITQLLLDYIFYKRALTRVALTFAEVFRRKLSYEDIK